MTEKPCNTILFFGQSRGKPSNAGDNLSGLAPHRHNGVTDQPVSQRESLLNFHGQKTLALYQLADHGHHIPAALSLSPSFCHELTEITQDHSTDKTYQELRRQLAKLSAPKSCGHIGQNLLVARVSSFVKLPLHLPFVQGLGLHKNVITPLEQQWGIPFAHYIFQRFIAQYAGLVWGIADWEFEDLAYDLLGSDTNEKDRQAGDWQQLTELYLELVTQTHGHTIPEDRTEQCMAVAAALSQKWQSPGLNMLRQLHNLADSPEPAIILQAMYFAHPDKPEFSGFCYSRHPRTGEKGLFGQFYPGLSNSSSKLSPNCPVPQKLASNNASIMDDLQALVQKLETRFREAVKLNFVYEDKTLWLLNAEPLRTEIHATIKIACDQVDEGLISKQEAIHCCDPAELSYFLHHSLEPGDRHPLITALPASHGASSGKVALDRHTALAYSHAGEDVILVRPETDPEDVHAIRFAAGVLTSQGGNSSHAAVIARSMGCPAVVGAKDLVFIRDDNGLKNISFAIGDQVFKNGDRITIDGQNGTVYRGNIPLREPTFPDELNRLLGWADEIATMTVRANADSLEETGCALNFGAKGIGLCRTEHMLLTPEALFHFRRVLLENDPDKKSAALQDILHDQKTKITGLFQKLSGLPVTVRLLDPPLHEFLPKDPIEIEALSIVLERPADELGEIVKSLEEKNPMLGHRGCRLAITLPELLEIQTLAILEAAKETHSKGITLPKLEIMIPFVMLESEISLLVSRIKTIADKFCLEEDLPLDYCIGTMIEIPRAALMAQKIAGHTDFFSFGTNDLTQTVWGLSRDDGDTFLRDYYSGGLLSYDPFKTLDTEGVGAIIAAACKAGKKGNPKLTLGICGEHGADPASISFFQGIGLDYVSCSPFQVPIARLAAGQAASNVDNVQSS